MSPFPDSFAGRAGPSLGFCSHIEGRQRLRLPSAPPAGDGVCTGPKFIENKKNNPKRNPRSLFLSVCLSFKRGRSAILRRRPRDRHSVQPWGEPNHPKQQATNKLAIVLPILSGRSAPRGHQFFPTEGRSRVITKTRARSRACARSIRRSLGGASAARAIMNASIASPWHRGRNPVGKGRNRCNVCQR